VSSEFFTLNNAVAFGHGGDHSSYVTAKHFSYDASGQGKF
jgi:hypothetical protein